MMFSSLKVSAWKMAGFPYSQRSKDAITDILGIVVITGSLLVYGILQERIMTIGFGPKAELFDCSIFLVLCNRLVTCLVAFAAVGITGSDVKPCAPLKSYCTVSLTNVIATSCQYEALKYVSFAIQTLAKSAKAFPVMIWGSIAHGKRYKATEYLHAAALCAGCTVFVLGGSATSRVVSETSSMALNMAGIHASTGTTAVIMGAGLMALYLAVDGMTSTYQDHMFSTYHMSIYDQVLFTTAFSALLSLMGSVAFNQLLPALLFIFRNPDALLVILALSVSSACVQLIISYTIKRYGALVFATIMTTRQFLSILLSSLVFWTPLTLPQWAGLVVVFGATYWRLVSGVLRSRWAARSTAHTAVKLSPAPHSSHQTGSGSRPDHTSYHVTPANPHVYQSLAPRLNSTSNSGVNPLQVLGSNGAASGQLHHVVKAGALMHRTPSESGVAQLDKV